MCSKAFNDEKSDWKLIQKAKEAKQVPYIESVSKPEFKKDLYES